MCSPDCGRYIGVALSLQSGLFGLSFHFFGRQGTLHAGLGHNVADAAHVVSCVADQGRSILQLLPASHESRQTGDMRESTPYAGTCANPLLTLVPSMR